MRRVKSGFVFDDEIMVVSDVWFLEVGGVVGEYAIIIETFFFLGNCREQYRYLYVQKVIFTPI